MQKLFYNNILTHAKLFKGNRLMQFSIIFGCYSFISIKKSYSVKKFINLGNTRIFVPITYIFVSGNKKKN